MSLITRCPACGTLFKVVPDQLRISEGWVRCGQCEEVFDGNAQLQSPDVLESLTAPPQETDESVPTAAVPSPVPNAAPGSAPAPGHDTAHNLAPNRAPNPVHDPASVSEPAWTSTASESPPGEAVDATTAVDPLPDADADADAEYDWGDVVAPIVGSASALSSGTSSIGARICCQPRRAAINTTHRWTRYLLPTSTQTPIRTLPPIPPLI